MDKLDLILQELQGMRQDITNLQEGQKGIRQDIAKMQEDIAEMRTDIEELQEGQEIIKSSCNILIEWMEAATEARELPLPKII